MSGLFRIIILVFLTRLTDYTSSKLDVIDSCDVPHSRDLVHPFLKQLQKVNRQRYKDFDEEDMNTYIEVKCFENIQYLHLCRMMLPSSFDTDKTRGGDTSMAGMAIAIPGVLHISKTGYTIGKIR